MTAPVAPAENEIPCPVAVQVFDQIFCQNFVQFISIGDGHGLAIRRLFLGISVGKPDIIQRDTHAALLASGGRYASMWALQQFFE